MFEFLDALDKFWNLIGLFDFQIHFFKCGNIKLAYFSHLLSGHSLAVFEFKTKLIYEIYNESCLSVMGSLSHICYYIIIRIINDFLDFIIEGKIVLYIENRLKFIES